jgi:hypothetical protein|uniref:Uncharacterized protein n=1 Tax=Populus trichocarpa TaxID=3694 RepID=A0A2K2B7L1_POPTR
MRIVRKQFRIYVFLLNIKGSRSLVGSPINKLIWKEYANQYLLVSPSSIQFIVEEMIGSVLPLKINEGQVRVVVYYQSQALITLIEKFYLAL